MKVKSESEVAQSFLTLCDPMDCSLPGSSIHGIFQARVLDGVPLPSPIPLTRQTFVGKVMSLLFNMLSRLAPHSSTLAWKIPWTEEPGRLQSMRSLRVGHDQVTSLSFFTFMHWRRKWQPTPVFLPGESQGRGSLWAAVYGVTQSRTPLKRLSCSRNSNHH